MMCVCGGTTTAGATPAMQLPVQASLTTWLQPQPCTAVLASNSSTSDLPADCHWCLQNRTYDRWWQARSAFGGIGGGLINIVRQVATYTDDPVLIHETQRWSMCMVYGERSFHSFFCFASALAATHAEHSALRDQVVLAPGPYSASLTPYLPLKPQTST
jgi:hypothetical protein